MRYLCSPAARYVTGQSIHVNGGAYLGIVAAPVGHGRTHPKVLIHRPDSVLAVTEFSPMYTDLKLFIDGQWLNGDGRKGEDVVNPATGKVLAQLPHASKADLDNALAAAEKGFQVWKATSAYDRAKIMRKAADLLRERAEHVASVQTQEQGKVVRGIAHRSPDLRRHHRLVCRGRPPRLRPHRAGPRRRACARS